MTKPIKLGRIAYEARFKTWPKGMVPDFDRLPQDQQAIWNAVADAISAPQVAALHNALDQIGFASAALTGAGDVRRGLIAENRKLRGGLVGALTTLERHEVFVMSKEKVKSPEGVGEWAKSLSEARCALRPPTGAEVAAVDAEPSPVTG